MNYKKKQSGMTCPLEEERKKLKPKKGWQMKKDSSELQTKTAPRKSLVPDYLFTIIFQQPEGN